jgi:hypothetical protein
MIEALMSRKRQGKAERMKSFEKARTRALARLWKGLDLQWKPAASRDALYRRGARKTS